jgi:hypothetical protein
MYSDAYYQTVERARQYHFKKEVYSGVATIKYHFDIKELVDKHNAKTLLDYGCGKGLQYTTDVEWEPGVATTLDKYLGITDVEKFDPCWPEFEQYPSLDKKYDGIILIQCLSFVPDNDLSILRQHLEKMSTKFCYIGERHSGTSGDVKPKKMKLVDTNFCTLGRSAEWYKEKFSGWQGPELIFDYI